MDASRLLRQPPAVALSTWLLPRWQRLATRAPACGEAGERRTLFWTDVAPATARGLLLRKERNIRQPALLASGERAEKQPRGPQPSSSRRWSLARRLPV